MTDYLFIKIAISCAVFGFVWVGILTPDRSILDWVKVYYPVKLEKPLNCPHCFSGWLSFFITCIYFICNYELFIYSDFLYIVLMPFFSMAIVQLFTPYEK